MPMGRRLKPGNGSIYYNKDRNNWTVSIPMLDLETGMEKRVRKSFATQELARQYLDEILLQKNNAIFIENNGIPLAKLMKMLLNKKMETNLITDRAYARTMDTIRIIEKCYLGSSNINEISTEEIQTFLNSLTEKYSNSSIQKVYFQFKNAFDYCLNKGYIHQNPMYEVIRPKSKKEDKIFRALNVEEQKVLTDYLLATNLFETPYRNVFLIQLYMGLRVGEALALTNNDINLERRNGDAAHQYRITGPCGCRQDHSVRSLAVSGRYPAGAGTGGPRRCLSGHPHPGASTGHHHLLQAGPAFHIPAGHHPGGYAGSRGFFRRG